MKQRWTLHFESLGRIDKGEVRIAPLMVFTGDNNAGKSYVMALLWGVIALGRDLIFQSEPPESESYRLCDQWLVSCIGQDVELDEAACALLVNWFSDALNQRRKPLCSAVFGEGRVALKQLRVRDYVRAKPLKLRWDAAPTEGGRYSSGVDYVRFPLPQADVSLASRYRMLRYLVWNLVMGDLSAPLFQMMQPLSPVPRGEILYLPAARTGFVLMRKVLASGLLGMNGGGDVLPLNAPTRRFVQRLLTLTHTTDGKYAEFARRLEADVLQGEVRPDAAPLPDYQYRPVGDAAATVPLWLSSSLVTEMTPLLMFLQSREDFRSLMIEEPEAHLHLALQARLARILVRLVNAGLPVWLTTHGDSFFQQISNLVKASALTKKELATLGLEKAETLSPNDISAWQFVVGAPDAAARGTRILPLRADGSGVAASSFNASISDLVQETLAINALCERDA